MFGTLKRDIWAKFNYNGQWQWYGFRARLFISFAVLQVITDLLLPCGFDSRACQLILLSALLRICPIWPYFLFLINHLYQLVHIFPRILYLKLYQLNKLIIYFLILLFADLQKCRFYICLKNPKLNSPEFST